MEGHSLQEVPESAAHSFAKEEEVILDFWDSIDAFGEQLRLTADLPVFRFLDGPPFATGKPHYGHVLAGTIKDIVTRYAASTGRHVSRRFGWDCHGLPVEHEVDKLLGVGGRADVLKMGVGEYNKACRAYVQRCKADWQPMVRRIGRWIDVENGYTTMDVSYMESVWWAFGQLFSKGLVYKGTKVVPFSTACSTSLSNFEAGQNYKDVHDPEIVVAFRLLGGEEHLLACTTTPWTLPANMALCVNPDLTYVKAKDPLTGTVFIVCETRQDQLPLTHTVVVKTCKGRDLVGRAYLPMFTYFDDHVYQVCGDGFVSGETGTGIVHLAPAFGEDDLRVCIAHGLLSASEPPPCPVDDSGRFTAPVTDWVGMYVKDADRLIIERVRQLGHLVKTGSISHSYPFCWRSDTPLIYKAIPTWFVSVERIKDRTLANNSKTRWVPTHVHEKRFHNWLASARDWAISRSRFWGTPMPIWISDDGEEIVVISSLQELEQSTGVRVQDLHREYIDHLTIPSRQGKGLLRRVDDVFDCWFESGSMPFAQDHYPFRTTDACPPADFVAEGLDQTRGWFYTLMVLSTALFDQPPFLNAICNGLVLASDGKKMSKRLKNYPDPTDIINTHGADALRLYLAQSPAVRGEPLKFQETGVAHMVRDILLPWYNAYRFLVTNVRRWEETNGRVFEPATETSGNVLDRWVTAASRSFTTYVSGEMEAYRVHNVVPRFSRFVNSLTNVYVRLNRRRLKGLCLASLTTLFDVLLEMCKTMAPFAPMFTESLFQNLRRCLPTSPASIHLYSGQSAAAAADERIERSVEGMQQVIELARTIRARHGRSVKAPVHQLSVTHTNPELVEDLQGPLEKYIREEVNCRHLNVSIRPVSIRAEPVWASLGPRMGKATGAVAAAIRVLTPEELQAFQRGSPLQVLGAHHLCPEDLRIVSDTPPVGEDGAVEGDMVVHMDLTEHADLVEAALARELISGVQQLRKKLGMKPDDVVEYYAHTSKNLVNVLSSPDVVQSLQKPVLPCDTPLTSRASIVTTNFEIHLV